MDNNEAKHKVHSHTSLYQSVSLNRLTLWPNQISNLKNNTLYELNIEVINGEMG